MSTIFNIVGDVKALNSLIESLTDEETGETRELTQEEKETFGKWVAEEQEKFERDNNKQSDFERIKEEHMRKTMG